MNDIDFVNRWEREKSQYEAWAKFIDQEIINRVSNRIAPEQIEFILKIPVKPRLKSDTSLLDKAFRRGKEYKEPYEDITDKVGLRYVVLLTDHIKLFCSVIENSECQSLWSWSKDKDYEQERLNKPLEFSYQSVHYVLRSKAGIEFDGTSLPEAIPCEVQIRTLLQHAHSELTHDTLYKPKFSATPSVRRTIAKSMALIEATDEFFESAIKTLNEANEPQRQLLKFLNIKYREGTDFEPEIEVSNLYILDSLMEFFRDVSTEQIDKFLQDKPYIFERIKERLLHRHLFRQPIVLFAYFIVERAPNRAKDEWPVNMDDLRLIFSDLGKSYD